jgi:hypothetical protein
MQKKGKGDRQMCCFLKDLLLGVVAAIAITALVLVVIGASASGFGPGIQAALVGAGGETIPDGTNVLFDTLNNQGSSIVYDPVTGLFSITRQGDYNIAWWVSTDGAAPATSVSFAVEVNGVPYSTASSPIVTGQLSGDAFVTINMVPATISLVNVTGEDVFVPDIPVQAGIVIKQ